MDGISLGLLIVAGYVAMVSLVRLMIRRRDHLINEFRERMAMAGRPEIKKTDDRSQKAA